MVVEAGLLEFVKVKVVAKVIVIVKVIAKVKLDFVVVAVTEVVAVAANELALQHFVNLAVPPFLLQAHHQQLGLEAFVVVVLHLIGLL